MEKKTACLVGAITSLSAMGSAQATVNPGAGLAETMQVSSYSELLKPIPNAAELLQASNAELLSRAQPVQYYQEEPPPPSYHHHHHHHHYDPPPPPVYHHHHHHHHHHNGVTIVVPGVGVVHSGN